MEAARDARGGQGADVGTPVTIIVPTFNERDNVAELVARTAVALEGWDAEILFVDDSTDDTAAEVERVAADSPIPVRVIHRSENTGGLGGAVVIGLEAAVSDVCIVMDGDLQHPPELLPVLLARFAQGDADVVAASRYVGGGDTSGLGTAVRFGVSRVATWLTRAMFPIRLARSTDPMTGFFLVDRDRLDVSTLQPRGFKILLEILARNDLRIAEVPMEFAERRHGTSKASFRQGAMFLEHLARLRFGKMSLFALIGVIGAAANLGIMWALTAAGVPYIWAAIIGAEVTIIGNFVLQERFVFADMRTDARALGIRFASSFAFNNVEAALRIPVMALMVESWHISSVVATGLSLIVAFFARFLFHSLVVYAPRRRRKGEAIGAEPPTDTAAQRVIRAIDVEVMKPGEL
ncbi:MULTISPECIES: glycosyltransferase [Microbacterium]|uniref:Glycosyltransferase family 2 protein n=1 Tax=Microbacterium maritypicum TaxID=33918 RepID=A0AAJ6AR67_MICMQ|nr:MULTISPECIES: glycosyltransferase family 2 protein [Microbacterium]EYT57489.1 glycosyl transferase family 2 [Microbacterium sp. UCD-TDU]MBP5800810.1 glycosyltransferase family 2 protein [Microbacterium liquefaciens]WEF21656.1 glycosyltransferase family 2 protein [Microbacterium liquefaciens]